MIDADERMIILQDPGDCIINCPCCGYQFDYREFDLDAEYLVPDGSIRYRDKSCPHCGMLFVFTHNEISERDYNNYQHRIPHFLMNNRRKA